MHEMTSKRQEPPPSPPPGACAVWLQRHPGDALILPWPGASTVRATSQVSPQWPGQICHELQRYPGAQQGNKSFSQEKFSWQSKYFTNLNPIIATTSASEFWPILDTHQQQPLVFLCPYWDPWSSCTSAASEAFRAWTTAPTLPNTTFTTALPFASRPGHDPLVTAGLLPLVQEKTAAIHRDYPQRVQQVLNWITAGDCYLFNLTDTLAFSSQVVPLTWHSFLERFYRVQADFNIYLNTTDGLQIHCHSPEQFLLIANDWVVTSPIKGTRRIPQQSPFTAEPPPIRGACHDLWDSPKEMAEQILVTDLLRHDLNGICEPGSVTVVHPCEIKATSGLLQMQTHVLGRLRANLSLSERLRPLLPCGSTTGAPKRQICSFLPQVESYQRGYYTGILGYHIPGVETRVVLLIRSLFQTPRGCYLGVGAGITAESDALAEASELCEKLKSFL